MTTEKDIDHQIQAAHATSEKLATIVYKAVVISTILYGCETSTQSSHNIRKFERFHQRMHSSIPQNMPEHNHQTSLVLVGVCLMHEPSKTALPYFIRQAYHWGSPRLAKVLVQRPIQEGGLSSSVTFSRARQPNQRCQTFKEQHPGCHSLLENAGK